MIARTFALHTAVIVLGVYSSGPPPIKNLYATAIVIGWGCVLFGSIFERTSERIGKYGRGGGHISTLRPTANPIVST